MDVKAKINAFSTEGPIKATASICLDDSFVVNGIKIIYGSKGYYIAMPNYNSKGSYKDICYPLTKDLRNKIEDIVVREYKITLKNAYTNMNEHVEAQNQEISM